MKHSILGIAVTVFGAATLSPHAAAGLQEEFEIAPCAELCGSIALRSVVVLGDTSDPAVPVRFTDAARIGNVFVAAPLSEPGTLGIYRPDGQLDRLVGREGAGPEEFRLPLIRGSGDKIWISDIDNNRLSQVSADGTIIDVPLSAPRVTHVLTTADTTIVVSGFLDPARPRASLHVVHSGTGALIRSFRPTPDRVAPLITRDPNSGHLLVAPLDRYEIEEWSTDGSLIRVLRRDPPWYRMADQPGEIATLLTGLGLDDSHRLWISFVVAVEDSRSIVDERPDWDAIEQRFDTVFEIIRLNDPQVVARGRHDWQLRRMQSAEDQLYLTVRGTRSGYLRGTVWEARVRE